MNKYELSIVLDGKTGAAKKKAVVEKVTKMVDLLKGKVGKIDDLGEKMYGIVLFIPLELAADAAKSLLNKVRLEEDIKKHLMIKVK